MVRLFHSTVGLGRRQTAEITGYVANTRTVSFANMIPTGTVTSATSTSARVADNIGLNSANDSYNLRTISFISGSRAGQTVQITDYDANTRTVSFDSMIPSGTLVAGGSTFATLPDIPLISGVAGYYNGRTFSITSGPRNGQNTIITSYTETLRLPHSTLSAACHRITLRVSRS